MRFRIIWRNPDRYGASGPVSPRLNGLGVRWWTAKPIADPVLRLDEVGTCAIGFDFLAETANVRAQHLRVNGVIGPPNFGEDLLEGQDLAGEAT